jgi:hypothetical protein
MNLSHYEPVNPHMPHRHREKGVEACRETVPAGNHAAVLALEPRTRPLGLEARDVLFHGAPTRLSGVPDACGDWGRIPRGRRRGRRSWASDPVSTASPLNRVRGLLRVPGRPWRASSSGMIRARSSPCAGVVRVAKGLPAPSVRRWIRRPWPFRPYATPSPSPLPGGKGASHRALSPVHQPARFGQPEPACVHGSQRPIALPAPSRGPMPCRKCAMNRIDGMKGNPCWPYRVVSKPLGLSVAGYSAPR